MRLRRPAEFRRVWATGRSWAHPLFILWAVPNNLTQTRIGLTASRKVGNAVARNRARRLLREAARLLYPYIPAGWDIVLVARGYLLAASAPQVVAALEQVLKRAELWETQKMECS
ncbi:MAG: ribonuclease P protein component [Anaerolineae bacterium]|nr:ribonuclease P protein component [Anaerolineae bacterium]